MKSRPRPRRSLPKRGAAKLTPSKRRARAKMFRASVEETDRLADDVRYIKSTPLGRFYDDPPCPL